MESIWLRIEKAMTQLDPPPAGFLPPGAKKKQLGELAALLPVPVPPDLAASLARHDGTGESDLPELTTLLSVSEIMAEYRRLSAGHPLVEGNGTVPFRREWIPIEAAGGVWTFIDADKSSPTFGGLLGASNEESDSFTHPMPSFRALLGRAADALEDLVPPAPAEEGAAHWALDLVKALLAQGELEVDEDAALPSIADAVDRAAGKVRAGERAVAEAILDALVDAPDVVEVFAEPDRIISCLRGSAAEAYSAESKQ